MGATYLAVRKDMGDNIPGSEEGHEECFDGADAGVEGKARKQLLVDVHGESVNCTLSGLTKRVFVSV